MSLHLMAIRFRVQNALAGMGIAPEAATKIGCVASVCAAGMIADHSTIYISEDLKKIIDLKSEISSEAVSQITTDSDALVNEMENIIASAEKQYDQTLNNLDNTKTEEILSQIDLAQARMSKDQEETEYLAKETDKLLNQLEDKAI